MKTTFGGFKTLVRRALLEYGQDGSKLTAHLKQAVKHAWEADNELGLAAQEADQEAYAGVEKAKKDIEKVAFDTDALATGIERGEHPKAASPSKRKLPTAPPSMG